MLFPKRRKALTTNVSKRHRARPSVEILEDRLVLNGATPSVLFQVDISGSEQTGTSFTHIQDVTYHHDLTGAPAFNDPPLVAMVPPATGKITASASIAVQGQDGMLSITQKASYRYDNFGGPPFVLHNLGLGESVSIYVLGAPGTPYTFASKASSVRHEQLGYIDYQNPGVSSSPGDYDQPAIRDTSSGPAIVYNGNIYSKINQLVQSNVGGGYYISRIIGGYPAFTDISDVTAQIDIKVVDLAIPQLAKLSLMSVDDTDPYNPKISFKVEGNFDNVEYAFDGTSRSLGPMSSGVHVLIINNLGIYPPQLHTLALGGTAGNQTIQGGTATIDTSFLRHQVESTFFIIEVPLKAIPFPRAIRPRWDFLVYKWEWSLPGAKWDRMMGESILTVTTSLASGIRSGQTHSISASMKITDSTVDGSYSYKPELTIGGSGYYGAAFSLPLHGFGKSGKTRFTLGISGNTAVPGGMAPWILTGTKEVTLQ